MAKKEKIAPAPVVASAPENPLAAPPMSVADLRSTHPDYNLKRFETYRDIIDGGESFHKNINNYLSVLRADKLGITLSAQLDLENPFPAGSFKKGTSEHENKISLTYLVPHALGVFNHIAGSVADDPPKISNAHPEKGQTLNPYWFKLAANMKALTRENVKRILQYGHPYISVTFPKTGALNKKQAGEAADKDGELNLIHPIDVLDWLPSGDDLVWCKVREKTRERAGNNPYGPANIVVETYTFATETEKRIYKIRYEVGKEGEVKDTDMKDGVIEPHTFGACPVFRVALDDDLWAAKHLEDAIKKLINLEADMSLYVKKVAHPILTAPDPEHAPKKVEDKIDSYVKGKLEYCNASSDAFLPMRQEKIDAKRELFECLSSLAQVEMGKSHVSPEVAEKEREPYYLLSRNYATALYNVYQKIMLRMQIVRGESHLSLILEGLKNPVTEGLVDRLKSLLDINQIPDFLPMARRWQIVKASRDICRDLPQMYQGKLDDQAREFLESNTAVIPPVSSTGDTPPDDNGGNGKNSRSEYNLGNKIPDLSKPEKLPKPVQGKWPAAGGPPGRS